MTTYSRREQMTVAECQTFVNEMLADSAVQKQFRVARTITVVVEAQRGQGGRAHGGFYANSRITLGAWARQPYVVIHELAHHLAGLGAGHNHQFCATTLFLTHRFMGPEYGEMLRASFVKKNVAYNGRGCVLEMPRPVRAKQLVPKVWNAEKIKLVSPPVRPERAAARLAAKKATVQPTTKTCRSGHGKCSHCDSTDAGSGGSFGKPLCLKCYRAWRKQIKNGGK